MEKEYGTKLRLLRVMLAVLERPYGYTKKQLASRYNYTEDTIKNDFRVFSDAGLVWQQDNKYRYAFAEEKPLRQLKDLLHFSEEDQLLLMQAIDQITPNTKRSDILKRKLASLYDYHRLGYAYLRRPYLSKIDALEEARKEKKRTILQDYHSTNSNIVNDRLIEPFHVNPAEDIVQAFDVDKMELRYFRISRFTRVRATEESWQFESRHLVQPADPFRIVDTAQETVHIRLNIGAYNDLIERFPLCKSYVQPSAEPDVYDLQCKVNKQFIGITNFLLGNHSGVEVIEPESLIDHLREEIKKMEF
jgi:predicted DNA-binding transcriptional regulator YafY